MATKKEDSIGISVSDMSVYNGEAVWARNENEWVFNKYASKEEKEEYKKRVHSTDRALAAGANDYQKEISLKYWDQAKKDYQADQAKKAEEARKKVEEEKNKAKPKTDYEEWKAKQPTTNTSKSWLSSINDFIAKNKDMIVGIGKIAGAIAAGVAAVAGAIATIKALTPQLKNLLSTLKDAIKNKKEPTPEEQKEIDKNPKSVSMKMYSFIRDSESFTPFVQSQGYTLKIGFGHIVSVGDPFYISYPVREDRDLINEYLEHTNDGTLDEWIKGIKPAIAPKDMLYTLYNQDIQKIESIINKEITDTLLEQHEFDALVSFLWTMRDESYIASEYSPERLIKEIHSLIYYDETKKTVASYMKEVDKELVQSSKIWNRRQSEVTLFLTGNYECLSLSSLEKVDYEEAFSDMKNQYLIDKTGNESLNNFTSFVGNDSANSAIEACDTANIILPSENGKKNSNSQSPNSILNDKIVGKMIYPVLLKRELGRRGYNNMGIVNVNTICYGWFGSEKGEGQGIHYGVDLVCEKNNAILMPYSGKIVGIDRAIESNPSTKLKRIAFIPDYNQDIIISIYYLVDLKVAVNDYITSGTLIGYVGDCSELFEAVKMKENDTKFDYIHVQANYKSIKGIPLNLTYALLVAENKYEDANEELNDLKEHPIVVVGTSGGNSADIEIQYPGKYQITLCAAGGADIKYNLNTSSTFPVTEAVPAEKRYSLVGTNGAYIIVNKFLEAGTYHYILGPIEISGVINQNSSFGSFINGTYTPEIICERGKNASYTSNSQAVNEPSNYTVPEDYIIVEASKGNRGTAVSNLCGYDTQTGDLKQFEITSGLSGSYKTYGKGGSVGLNGANSTPPTYGYIKIQYLGMN